MATLTGQTIASSYEQLLHVDRDGGGNGATLVNVKDGDNGTTFALQLSTTAVKVDGDLTIDGDLTVSGSATNTFDETITGQLIAGTTLGSASVPSLALGDGNTGFYEETDNRLQVSIAGSKKLEFGEAGDYIQLGGSSGYPAIDTSAVPSATNPGYMVSRADSNTGIGSGGADTLNLITNAVSRLVVDNNSRISLSNNDSGGASGLDSTSGNTLVGYKAGNAIADGGEKNTFFGHNAGLLVSTTDENVAIGANSMGAAGTTSSTVIGFNAGNAMTGAENTLIGANSDVDTNTDSYQVKIGSYGMVKYKTIRWTYNTFDSGGNAAEDVAHSNALVTFPAYSFIKRVVVKIVTLSSNTDSLFKIGLSATTNTAIGDDIGSPIYVLAASGLGTGFLSRSQASQASDTSIDCGNNGNAASEVGMVFIGEDHDMTNNSDGWLDAVMGLYVVHAGSNTNSDPTTNPVLDIMVEYY